MNRKTARACAMKLVYEWDMGGEGGESTIAGILEVSETEAEYGFMKSLADGVIANSGEIDAVILRYLSEGWTPDRISKVDTAILRIAVYEILHTDTEVKFIINEAVELAKEYSAEKSAPFVNGVLGNLVRSRTDA